MVSLVCDTFFRHQVLSPSPFPSAYIFVAERASICLGSWLSRKTCQRCCVLSINVDMNALTAPFALSVLLFMSAFFHQVRVQRRDLDDLSTSITVCEHQAAEYVVEIQFLRIPKFLLTDPTELASWWRFRLLVSPRFFHWGRGGIGSFHFISTRHIRRPAYLVPATVSCCHLITVACRIP